GVATGTSGVLTAGPHSFTAVYNGFTLGNYLQEPSAATTGQSSVPLPTSINGQPSVPILGQSTAQLVFQAGQQGAVLTVGGLFVPGSVVVLHGNIVLPTTVVNGMLWARVPRKLLGHRHRLRVLIFVLTPGVGLSPPMFLTLRSVP